MVQITACMMRKMRSLSAVVRVACESAYAGSSPPTLQLNRRPLHHFYRHDLWQGAPDRGGAVGLAPG
jgi:hypothetical protein